MAITFIQSAATTGPEISLPSVVSGNTIIGAVLWAGNPGLLPVDDQNNTYVASIGPWAAQPFGQQVLNPYLQIFHCIGVGGTTGSPPSGSPPSGSPPSGSPPSGSPPTSFNVTFPTDDAVMACFLAEYSGVTTFVKGVGAAGFGGINPFTTPYVAALVGDLLFSVADCNGTKLRASGGFTSRSHLEFPTCRIADRIVATAGKYQGSFSAINVDNYAILMGQFR